MRAYPGTANAAEHEKNAASPHDDILPARRFGARLVAILAGVGTPADTGAMVVRQEERRRSTCTGCRSARVGTSSGSTVACTRRWRRGCSAVPLVTSITPRSRSNSGGDVCHRADAGHGSERQEAGGRRRRRRRESLGRPVSNLPLRDPVWPGGHIPDVAEAVDSPRRLTTEEAGARRVLEAIRRVPTPVWGRDERNGRDVELQLSHSLDARAQRNGRRVDSASDRGTRAWLASWGRRRRPQSRRNW